MLHPACTLLWYHSLVSTITVHPQVLCLCLTVRAALSELPQIARTSTGGLSGLQILPALAMDIKPAGCLMLGALISAQMQLISHITQARLMTVVGHIAVAGLTETTDIAAAVAGLRTALIAAPASILQNHRGMPADIMNPRVMTLGLTPGQMPEVLSVR